MALTLTLNGKTVQPDTGSGADERTPLLYLLRNDLGQ